MTAIAVVSLKASPGVTTTALALTATWPQPRAVVLAELDPSGGDIAARFGLKQTPGLVSYAAAARKEHSGSVLREHTQQLSESFDVLVGPPSAEHARSALIAARHTLRDLRALHKLDIVADLGRVDPALAQWPLLDAFDMMLIAVRPVLTELQHLAASIESLRTTTQDIAVVTIGSGPYGASEISDTLKVDVLGNLPLDGAAAAALNSGTLNLAKIRRSALVRAARALNGAIAARLAQQGEVVASEQVSA